MSLNNNIINEVSSNSEPFETKLAEKTPRKYHKIEDDRRILMLRLLKVEKMTLKKASESLNINYSTAKTIMQTFRKEGRIKKKLKRNRKKNKALPYLLDFYRSQLGSIPYYYRHYYIIPPPASQAHKKKCIENEASLDLLPHFNFHYYSQEIVRDMYERINNKDDNPEISLRHSCRFNDFLSPKHRCSDPFEAPSSLDSFEPKPMATVGPLC